VLANPGKKNRPTQAVSVLQTILEKRRLKMTTPSQKQTVSLCMIVRDEERNLPVCLRPIRGVVNDIIVVDAGSVDRTKPIAAAFGARIFDFPWCDSFSAARNESIKHATTGKGKGDIVGTSYIVAVS
jgi:Glycosyl transferase family 2